MELQPFVDDFAAAMCAADARGPQATSARSGRVFQRGIGPHSEDAAVALTVAELNRNQSAPYLPISQGIAYPGSQQRCDLGLYDPLEWVVEIKMARFSGDNGKPDDTAIKDILSPYLSDRSALSDCVKLANSAFSQRKAVLIYGFDDVRRPLGPAIAAFETLANSHVTLGPRSSSRLSSLIHPVFSSGTVFAWEILGLSSF